MTAIQPILARSFRLALPMPLDLDSWRAALADARSAMDIVANGTPEAFRALSSERKASAIILGKEMAPEIGLASTTLDASNPAMFAEILATPQWAVSCASSEKRLAETSRHLAAKIVDVDALSCLPAAAGFDSAIPWLAALRWASDSNRHDSHVPLSLKILSDLGAKAIGDNTPNGGVTERALKKPQALAGFQAALSTAASQYLDPASSTPPCLQGQDLHDALILAGLARAMAADSSVHGPGAPAAARAGIHAAKAIASAHADRRLRLPKGLLPLLLRWGCSGRGESSSAIDIAETLLALRSGKEPPLALPRSDFDMSSQRFGPLPDAIDAAWLCAAHAREPEHIESARRLAAHARGPIPSTKLEAQGKVHPLSHMRPAWENTVQAGRSLPKAYIGQCVQRALAEARSFGSQWKAQKDQWIILASGMGDALLSGLAQGAFPPGTLPTIPELCAKLSMPVAPIEWRLGTDSGLRQGSSHDAGGAVEQCFLATAAIGMDPVAAIQDDTYRLMHGVSPAVRHSLERAELRMLHPDPSTEKIRRRI